METIEIFTAFGSSALGALVGAAIALYSTHDASRRLAQANDQEQRRAEKAALRAASLELDVAVEIANEESATDLPIQMLTTVLPIIHHMTQEQQSAMIAYSQRVLRHNGRVRRLVLYGAAKRIRGENPGAEKPDEHAARVRSAAPAAKQALVEHMASSRYPDDGTAPATPR
ncbi:hypothetical protein [Streptomyces sp. NPDC058614]|uniref:hypothetical protein n=1 Tax=Streptomyces sp. NPDC058614 TaxID=3346557 RepID=UPI003661D5C5